MILHIAEEADWATAQDRGRYEAQSLATQGFIHCSNPDQLVRVADGIFRGRTDLVLLTIDPAKLTAEVRYENLEGGTVLFPHVYGAIELEAVTRAQPFAAGSEGRFTLPPVL